MATRRRRSSPSNGNMPATIQKASPPRTRANGTAGVPRILETGEEMTEENIFMFIPNLIG